MTSGANGWQDAAEFLASTEVPAATANRDLLLTLRPRWQKSVEAKTSMHDLLFIRPGDGYPWQDYVEVEHLDSVFEVRVFCETMLIAGDRCTAANAPAVVEAALMQLVGDEQQATP